MIKEIQYRAEAFLLLILMLIFSVMPARLASDIGGVFAEYIGPRMGASKTALRHLKRAFPDLEDCEHKKILRKMWNNLGRIFAEFPHIKTLAKNHTKITNSEILRPLLEKHKHLIFIGGHIGNWEINSAASLLQKNIAVDISYRALNNPYCDKILLNMRSLNGTIKAHAKSRSGGRSLIESLKNLSSVGILIDQKYREGVCISFFNQPAMTNPIFVQLALKYDIPIIPIRCERLDNINFSLTLYDPIETQGHTIEDIVQSATDLLERWITERPEQWLWLHRRWKD